MDATDRQPGDAEAAAAAAGMQDTYGRPPAGHAIGDTITWRDAMGVLRQGRVEMAGDNGRLAVRDGYGIPHVIETSQIARL
jgi:hypothetical protein